ncbi:Putative helicase XPB/Ssl2, Helicase superfamily 1/2, ATP-binding domain-containing protein [Septoria linicola]|uniref:DNA 3'-5' helicase n=1 Tax=Septoria linicola TaxID=215465 RepID=A0A9Q9ANC2_9PEZI|nr:putative helicase XPB/Ssl2, Helicase superfamily 1/2, ATP-binding domain-containing protein [Septoria linicola]USW51309.1 Putative helicase XPB/Ssl2, Helicase superfamily 1/2, ATP-binding domain-containing protein [Septoria linicola]
MPPKRKAVGADGRATKRVASGANTPISMRGDDDDDFDESSDDFDEEERQAPKKYDKVVKRYQPATYQKPAAAASSNGDAASHLFKSTRDFFNETLKPDHHLRPLWIDPTNGKVVLETFAPSFKQAQNFLINIAEPQSRTTNMHEYTISPHSLFAAVSVGLTEQDIIRDLELFSKTKVPANIIDFVHEVTQSFGKVRLVLKHNKYFIESNDASVLQMLLRDPVISGTRVEETDELKTDKAAKKGNLVISGTDQARADKEAMAQAEAAQKRDDEDESDDEFGGRDAEKTMTEFLREEEDDEDTDLVHSFEIDGNQIQKVQEHCNVKLNLPLTEEYDFRADDLNANLDIDLRPNVQIRYYQEHALSKMFGNGRARSGIIVLPCGAGKTLVGITAACTVKKSAIVLCTSAMSAVQWKEEFKKWSNINPDDIAIFTSGEKESLNQKAGVIICTYSMVTQNTRRAHDSKKVMDFITGREWGLMVLDEVHVVPAEMFRRVTERIKTHSKLGLTATLLREDDKIKDLNFLIGPKLYEANWLQLSEEGHIARVQCAEVWCPMTTEFYKEYLDAKTTNKRSLLSTMNPRKYQACQFLIDFHERRGDKIIVFSDNVYALKKYAEGMTKPYIYGDTSQREREVVLQNFQQNDAVSTIFLSKIGDTSLDLPEATCLIQISSHYGSRRQEAQRLGRILRAKRRNDEGFNAFFYSLVSKDTNEMYYSSKRQAFLVDQGYAFKVITHLNGIEKMPNLQFNTQHSRMESLTDVLLQSETIGDVEDIKDDLFSDRNVSRSKKKGNGVRRQAGTLSSLAGGDNMAYMEHDRGKNPNKALAKPRNTFFKKNAAAAARRAKAAKDFADEL